MKNSPAVFLNYSTASEIISSEKSSTFQTDTIKPASFALPCYTTNPGAALVLYYADVKVPHDSGYVSGTNIYGDLEKAQHFVNTTSTTLTGCAVLLKRAFSSTSVTIGTKVKLYGYSGGVPTTTVIATSSLIPQNQLNNNGLTVFSFSAPVIISNDFVMSVALPNHAGDTTAIFSTQTSCNSSASHSWEKAIDNSWGSIHSNWNFSATQNIDLAIFPLKQGAVVTGIPTNYNNDYIIVDGVNHALKIQPLPKSLVINITDIAGRFFLNQAIESNQNMDLNFLNNGVYIITLTDQNQVVYRKKVLVL